MDISSLSETQQQQLQQLHQQFQQHQQEQQQKQLQQQEEQQRQLASQAYDPSQSQAYDHQAYYAYHQYQQQQQQYPYYDYSNAYQQPDSTPIHPPGISVAPPAESSQPYIAQEVPSQPHYHQHNPYYPQPIEQQQQLQQPPHHPNSLAYPVSSGLNPAAAAAVAALSQLTQFAGSMDAAERAMAHERQWQAKGGGYGPMQMSPHMYPHGGVHHGPFPGRGAGRVPYRGGGRRGGGPFRGEGRGGGRGNFGDQPLRTDGSGPPFRGRGRGRGGGRRSTSSHRQPTEEVVSAAVHGDVPTSVANHEETPISSAPATAAPGKTSVTARALGKVPSARRPQQIAWCELCRVDCTSLEILEQHKNGKKHKKNLQRFEESQNTGIPLPMPMVTSTHASTPASVSSTAHDPTPTPMSVPDSPTQAVTSEPVSATTMNSVPKPQNEVESLVESKAEVSMQPENVGGAAASENLLTETAINENNMETEQKNDLVLHPEVSESQRTGAPRKGCRFDRLDGHFDTRNRGTKRKMMVRAGRGGKRMRATFERPMRPVERPKPKEVIPLICDLCNVKCDTQAVYDCHLGGKKHISKMKRFQGHQAMFGPVGLQALYPPNPNTQSVFIPPVHQQVMYPPQGGFVQPEVCMPQPHQTTVNQHVAVEPQGQSQPEVYMPQPHQATAVVQEGRLAAQAKPESSVAVSVDKVPEASSDKLLLGSPYAVQAPVGSIPVPDYGITFTENVILPGLEIKTVEAVTANEESA